MKMAIYFLTCKDNKEADRISKALLDNKLIACAKKFPVESKFWWNKKIDNAKEVLVMLESIEENFEKIEKTVEKLHSYKTPVLFSIPVLKTTKRVEKWMKEELK